MKRKRDKEEENDRLSDLPDFVLLHIMEFMNTKEAVQTCVLSTRWKDLWRRLTNLALNFNDFANLCHFSRFLRSILSHRDNSISLHDIYLGSDCNEFEYELLQSVMTYAVSHNVQKLSVDHMVLTSGYLLDSCIYSCQSLTHLKLSVCGILRRIELPTSLQLPALKCLYLGHVILTANAKGIVDPFSKCRMLNTLVLSFCKLQPDGKFIHISNSKLSGLTIATYQGFTDKIVLSTPKLSSLTLMCDLTPQTLLLYTSDSIITQLPCFVKLKSLKLKAKLSNIPDEEVRMLVNCFLKKCPLAKVSIY
ncbi:hypothetical protein TSUD_292310 [Trifolium subterraneum]|uniref:F-box domain-containing protein n=1 Tax=Trifolium subterraneum TaxID=3900 RepID=A0A2Z6NSA3_TRISU|nr:hypothetical protein TSUD_292310 [Trifolium subterraneum]